MVGAQPVLIFWYGYGIHVMVVLSFLVQVTLFLLADIRRRKDWAVVRAIIWLAYTLADTAAVYALGHMSVVSRSPEHHLMALWAPLLLVHLGGQDNITAYAIEDNRLWLRHLLTFVLQVLPACYVLYASSILSRPYLLRTATILMFVVGFLKYGERVWSLWDADKYASSSLSATSYKDFRADHKECPSTAPEGHRGDPAAENRRTEQKDCPSAAPVDPPADKIFPIALSLLDVPKQMFQGPTRYVKRRGDRTYTGEYMLKVVEVQLSMMYDLLYTKAAVVHTLCGICIRVISLPFTVAALRMFHVLLISPRDKNGYYYGRADVAVTYVLLTGAVAMEVMSVLRAVFSMWTAALLYEREWHELASKIAFAQLLVTRTVKLLLRTESYWSGYMRQHSMFDVIFCTNNGAGSKVAKRMGREDWWDSMFYSRQARVLKAVIDKVLELPRAEDGEDGDISRAQGLHAVRRSDEGELATLIEGLKLELADSILVWSIATSVYISWYIDQNGRFPPYAQESDQLSDYMFFLLAARPYMLPYPVTRQRYVQLFHDCRAHHLRIEFAESLLGDILKQQDALMGGSSLNLDNLSSSKIASDTGTDQASINSTLDGGSQLAAKLIQRAAENADGIMEMIFQVWVEMLCYTAYGCNEKSHAQNLNNGGDIMTIVALLMVYKSNGYIENTTVEKDRVPPTETTTVWPALLLKGPKKVPIDWTNVRVAKFG